MNFSSSKVPARMKYMSYNPIEGHLSLKVSECDTPFYDKDYEVLIKVEATAVNRADLLQT
jgi:tumor protein p53-inducible protein 3